ncbi:MAG: hypothetical protein LBV60_16175 [Streptomyces sp.]|nr:hypothetical protein [Streptomyces sp.]
MHRTTTTATLLVTMTISALSGCTTVQRSTAPGPSPAPSSPSTPRPDGSPGPRVVQAPAREALELVQPSPVPSPSTRPRHTTEPAPTAMPAAPPHGPSAPRRPKRTRPGPHVGVPPTPAAGILRNADLCALGRRYGGWQANSPEAAICQRTYGR